MSRRPTRSLGLAVLAVVAILTSGCGGQAATAVAPGSTVAAVAAVRTVGAADAVAMLADRVVIDVRTPEEFAAGHLAGAQNIDVQSSDFATRIAALDSGAAYLVYCRSGNRSAAAAAAMAASGFTDVVDGGGLEALVAAGAATE